MWAPEHPRLVDYLASLPDRISEVSATELRFGSKGQVTGLQKETMHCSVHYTRRGVSAQRVCCGTRWQDGCGGTRAPCTPCAASRTHDAARSPTLCLLPAVLSAPAVKMVGYLVIPEFKAGQTVNLRMVMFCRLREFLYHLRQDAAASTHDIIPAGGAVQQRHPARRNDGAADVQRRHGRRDPDHPRVHIPRVQPEPGRARDGDPGALAAAARSLISVAAAQIWVRWCGTTYGCA